MRPRLCRRPIHCVCTICRPSDVTGFDPRETLPRVCSISRQLMRRVMTSRRPLLHRERFPAGQLIVTVSERARKWSPLVTARCRLRLSDSDDGTYSLVYEEVRFRHRTRRDRRNRSMTYYRGLATDCMMVPGRSFPVMTYK